MNSENDQTKADLLYKIIEEYKLLIEDELDDRWSQWGIDLAHPEKYEVIGALLARMVTLAHYLAGSPGIWNAHIAPIILRSMIDTYINLAWIFIEPQTRSLKFIAYGLGQAKLHLEHLRNVGDEVNFLDKSKENLDWLEHWINSQRYTFLTEVNVGNWSGIDTRTMAEEAGCKDIYTYAYIPFSNATHNTWYHIGRLNLQICRNPLHGYHRVPVTPDFGIDLEYFRLAAKYTDKAFRLFDEKTEVISKAVNSYKYLLQEMKKLNPVI